MHEDPSRCSNFTSNKCNTKHLTFTTFEAVADKTQKETVGIVTIATVSQLISTYGQKFNPQLHLRDRDIPRLSHPQPHLHKVKESLTKFGSNRTRRRALAYFRPVTECARHLWPQDILRQACHQCFGTSDYLLLPCFASALPYKAGNNVVRIQSTYRILDKWAKITD